MTKQLHFAATAGLSRTLSFVSLLLATTTLAVGLLTLALAEDTDGAFPGTIVLGESKKGGNKSRCPGL
jgi:hypothetical protein